MKLSQVKRGDAVWCDDVACTVERVERWERFTTVYLATDDGARRCVTTTDDANTDMLRSRVAGAVDV